MSHWTISASLPLAVLMGLIWLATGSLSWVNWRRRRGRGTAAMELLRFVTVTFILLTLLQPERVWRQTVTETPAIVVLPDRSSSMLTRDVLSEGTDVISRSQWLDQCLATNFWNVWSGQAKVVVEAFAKPGTATNETSIAQGTDLNQALEAVLERQQHLKAALLLTDGDWNIGKNPLHAAGRFRAQQVPLFTVAVGSETRLPDLVLEPIAAPAYSLLGEQISIPFHIRSYLPREVRTVVSMALPSGPIARQEVIIPPFGQIQDNLLWMPQAVGEYLVNVSLPVQPEEYLTDNNAQSFRLAIRTEKLRVLVIDSVPRWEYRYLRNALERDPGVEVSCLLYHPGLPIGQGTNYLDRFPTDREGLARYDVVFLGDVGVGDGELTEQDALLLRGLVEQQASGLVFLPGRRGRLESLMRTPLAELLPVVPDTSKFSGLASPLETPVQLTLSGQAHFLTMLAGNQARNAAVWKTLPGFFWCAAVEKPKPGAEVLAVHPSLRNAHGRMPLLAVRPFGQGEVLFLGIDSAWRWRRGVEDRYHYRFWGQVVRWMAHKRHMAAGEGLRLTFSPEQPQTGDQIFIQATVLDLLDWQENETLSTRIQSPSGQTEQIDLRPVPGGWGVYQANFRAEAGGTYRLALAGSRPGRRLDAQITVASATVEQLGQPANAALLREMAQLTRGASGTTADLNRLVTQITLLPDVEPAEQRFQLWANPWWGGWILFLLAIYWTARKAAGMI
jgi:hypothetical protein